MKFIKPIYYFFVNTNLLIAGAAVAQCALTYIILNLPVNGYLLLIEGSTTLLLYNFSLYLSKPTDPSRSPFQRTRWVFRYIRLFWFLSILSILILIYALLQVHLLTLLYLGFIALISLAYAVPIVKINNKRIGMRQVPGLKVFYIALVWSLSSVGLPVIELFANGETIEWFNANYLGLVKIIFLVLCTLPFDIRDYEQDSLYQLKTVPILLGKEKAILLSYGIALFHILLVVFSPYTLAIKYGMFCTTVIILILLKFVIFAEKKKHYHHVYLLDLALILQWLLVLLFL